MSVSACTYCGCTEEQACDGGCGWTDDSRTVCSQCQFAAGVATMFLGLVRQAAGQPVNTQVLREYSAAHQQLYVMGTRAILERLPVVDAEDHQALLAEVGGLLEVLEARYPREVATARARRTSLVTLVSDLLDARRIVLAGG